MNLLKLGSSVIIQLFQLLIIFINTTYFWVMIAFAILLIYIQRTIYYMCFVCNIFFINYIYVMLCFYNNIIGKKSNFNTLEYQK